MEQAEVSQAEVALARLESVARWLREDAAPARRERRVLEALLGVADVVLGVDESPDGFAVVHGSPTIAVRLDEPFVAVPMSRPKPGEWVRTILGYDYEAMDSGNIWARLEAGLTVRVRAVGHVRATFRPRREAGRLIAEEVLSQALPAVREAVLEEALRRLAEKGVTEHTYRGATEVEVPFTADPAKAAELVRHLLRGLPLAVERGVVGAVVRPRVVGEALEGALEGLLTPGWRSAVLIEYEPCTVVWHGTPPEVEGYAYLGGSYARVRARLAWLGRITALADHVRIKCGGREFEAGFKSPVGVEVDTLPTHPIERAVRNAVALRLL